MSGRSKKTAAVIMSVRDVKALSDAVIDALYERLNDARDRRQEARRSAVQDVIGGRRTTVRSPIVGRR